MRKTLTLAALAAALATGGVHAADFGVYATAGTIGLGGGLAANFNKHLGVRLGYATYEYDVEDLEESDLTFDGSAEIGGVHGLVDWYPFGGGFRLSAGVMQNPELSARAVPTGDTFTFDDVTYRADQVGEARAVAEYGSTAPYVGLGFGRALDTQGRFSLSADLGVAFTGAPDVKLDVTCQAAAAMVCAQLAGDVAAEQAQLQEDAEDFKYWPVLNLSVSYRF